MSEHDRTLVSVIENLFGGITDAASVTAKWNAFSADGEPSYAHSTW
jgi:hypothetical protein